MCRYSRRKATRIKKKREKLRDNPDNIPINDDDDEDDNLVTIKCGLKTIIKRKFRKIIIEAITKRSLQATKMCALASLLFLNKVHREFDATNQAFFNQSGEQVIIDCFYGVLIQNALTRNGKMLPEFRQCASNLENFEWPNNKYFGNAMKDLHNTYITNVKTNLNTHCKKRIREFLRMKVYENNLNPIVVRFEECDIANAIRWCIFGLDISNQVNDIPVKRERRNLLLQMVYRLSWCDIEDGNIAKFTKNHWFKSMQLWISIQRQIDEFNINDQRRNERQRQRHQRRPRQQQQPNPNEPANKPPLIKNLTVIPICEFARKHFPIDNDVLQRIFNDLKITKNKNGKQTILESIIYYY